MRFDKDSMVPTTKPQTHPPRDGRPWHLSLVLSRTCWRPHYPAFAKDRFVWEEGSEETCESRISLGLAQQSRASNLNDVDVKASWQWPAPCFVPLRQGTPRDRLTVFFQTASFFKIVFSRCGRWPEWAASGCENEARGRVTAPSAT